MKVLKQLPLYAGLAVMMAGQAQADNDPNPYLQPNNEYINLSGTVVSTAPDAFVLDYGEGLVTVEMDDWDWYSEGYQILRGDDVTVYGKVDDDFYEQTTIEAGSVYVKQANTYYYASPIDEEGGSSTWVGSGFVAPAAANNMTNISGTIINVDGREFLLSSGSREIRVDTSEMPYNPLDNKGFQQLDEGDIVTVSGDLDIDLFKRNELTAQIITTLVNDNIDS